MTRLRFKHMSATRCALIGSERQNTPHDEYPLSVGKEAELVPDGVPVVTLVELADALTELLIVILEPNDKGGDGVWAHTNDANSTICRKTANDGDIEVDDDPVPETKLATRRQIVPNTTRPLQWRIIELNKKEWHRRQCGWAGGKTDQRVTSHRSSVTILALESPLMVIPTLGSAATYRVYDIFVLCSNCWVTCSFF